MSSICPAVLADTIDEYREQMDVISSFAGRIHVDLGDGHFTTKTIEVSDVWWPEGVVVDVHLMHKHPEEAVRELCHRRPNMIILHSEASEDLEPLMLYIKQHSVNVGVALLQDTKVEAVRRYIELADHVLIFSGSLGSFGGVADLSLLGKIPQIRAINHGVEIGWDGGANEGNVEKLSDGGVDVMYVGGAIQKASHPVNAYRTLERLVYH